VRYLAVLFVVVPLAELYALLWLGERTGVVPTLAMTLASGILGSILVKREGLAAYRAWRRSLDSLAPPEVGLVEGLLILVGAVLLLTPGLLTDVAAFVLLLPWTRRWIAKRLKARIEARLVVQRAGVHRVVIQGAAEGRAAPRGSRPVVDGTGEDLDQKS
jgi:UPF0716 protein FxsA